MNAKKPIHSPLGASSMYRWAACPGSVKMSEGLERQPSTYAEEGSNAHHLAEFCLANGVNVYDLIDKPMIRFEDKKAIEYTPDEEMAEAVDIYLQYLDSLQSPGDTSAFEQGFDLGNIYPGMYGTNDACIYKPAEKHLYVIDYKHGRGMPVEVENNLQLLYYAIGAAQTFADKGLSLITLAIVQPRCPHANGPVRTWTINAATLIDWVPDLIQAAQRTAAPDAPRIPGEHCHFCTAAAICPELSTKALCIAQAEFSSEGHLVLPNPESFVGEKAANILTDLPILEHWIKKFRAFQHLEAEHGRCLPGFKLVQKRANRKWANEEQAIKQIQTEFKLKREDIFTEKFKSPAQIEKLVKGKALKQALESLIVKESSGTTLVPEGDKRETITPSIEQDFGKSVVGSIDDLM